MERHEAVFEIDSQTDAHAARHIMERAYDTVREESRSVREGTADADALLADFEALRDALDDPAPGTLTITYERTGDGFGD